MPSALERCVGDPAAFLEATWSRHPALYPGADDHGFADLLSLDDVDRIVSSTALRLPAFRLIKDGATLPESSYTRTGRAGSKPMAGIADPARIFRLFDQGATIVLQGMHRFWLPLARFCRDLELSLGHPAQVNAYITPPGSRGLAVHEDSHEVFVLQAFGSKHWEVWDTRRPAGGDPDPKAAVEAAAAAAPAISAEVGPGDAIYMPTRTPHAARTQRALSGHLTVGVPAITWRQVIERTVLKAIDGATLDEPLPAAYHMDPAGLTREVEARLAEAGRGLEKIDPAEVASLAVERFLTTRPSLVRGSLSDLARLGQVDDHTLLRRRDGSVFEIIVREERITVLLGDRALRLPRRCEPALRAIPGAGPFTPSDLGPHLDPPGRLVLVRRLIREGLLEVLGVH